MAVVKKGLHIRLFGFRITLTVGRVCFYLCLIALVLFTALPLIYIVSTAFKPLEELVQYPPRFLVRNPTMDNFKDLLSSLSGSVVPFLRYVFNSLSVAAITVIFSVVICSMGAYSLSKLRPVGSGVIFLVIIGALMFTPYVTHIPTYMIIDSMHMTNTHWALILPKVAVAFNLFLLKQFVDQLPDPLLEAARIDGASEARVFRSIVMPFLSPAWATVMVFSFVNSWNDFFSPLIYIRSEELKTLPLVFQNISGGVATVVLGRAGGMAAAVFLTFMPPVIIFMLSQKKVVQTMAHSGIK